MIANAFKKGPAFIGYLTLGDGGLDYSLQAALALVQGGVDLLEIGLPFSDPIADGPVIQKAMERSLQAGTRSEDLITFLNAFRQQSAVPVVVFSYYNPILAAGEDFLLRAREAGASGLLVVDAPFEVMPESVLDPILIVSTSTPQERVEEISRHAKGFIYYACQKGTTGMRGALPTHSATDIARIRQTTSLPVAIGFGISTQETAREALKSADAFVVGSYFVEAMGRKATPEELTQLAKEIDPRRSL
jgi:tryptophan synthase alpha chain